MERLTVRINNSVYCLECFNEPHCVEKCRYCEINDKIREKLADYESTDLTPEEIQQMRVELAVARAIASLCHAEKPEIYGDSYDDNGNLIYDKWKCPRCGKSYEMDYDDYDYCPNCGQKIDWSDEDE